MKSPQNKKITLPTLQMTHTDCGIFVWIGDTTSTGDYQSSQSMIFWTRESIALIGVNVDFTLFCEAIGLRINPVVSHGSVMLTSLLRMHQRQSVRVVNSYNSYYRSIRLIQQK